MWWLWLASSLCISLLLRFQIDRYNLYVLMNRCSTVLWNNPHIKIHTTHTARLERWTQCWFLVGKLQGWVRYPPGDHGAIRTSVSWEEWKLKWWLCILKVRVRVVDDDMRFFLHFRLSFITSQWLHGYRVPNTEYRDPDWECCEWLQSRRWEDND